jgi:AbrB family looped-hinge helix DNA binding protein
MNTATLSSKFQISVPKPVRDALGLVPGQKLAFIQTGSGIRLVPQAAVADLVGLAKGANTEGLRDRDERLLPQGGQGPKSAPQIKRKRRAL